jgi:predicted RNase H-like nuclease (RuvC/YqgF family)
MLEPKDLKKIGEELGKVIEQNVTPTLDSLDQRVGHLDQRVGHLDQRVGNLEREVGQIRAEMVTKSYLDDKLADLEGGVMARLRKEDTKVNRLVDMLKNKRVLTEQEVSQLAELQVFPKVL